MKAGGQMTTVQVIEKMGGREGIRTSAPPACKAGARFDPIQQPHGLWVEYAAAYRFRIFWPTDGLRIVHSVGFAGFLVWLFCINIGGRLVPGPKYP